MAKNDQSKPLPLWARALISMVAIGMLCVLTSIIVLTATIKHQCDIAQNPKAISQLLHKMIRLPDPLPKGYSYVVGLDFGLCQFVTVDYEGGKQRIVFFSCPTAEKMDARQMLSNSYEQGILTTDSQAAKFTDVLSEGSWKIQDEEIPYRIGRLEGHGTGLVACFVNGVTNRALIIYAIQPEGEKFDTRACTTLLMDAE